MNRYTFSDQGLMRGIQTTLLVPELIDTDSVMLLVRTGRPDLFSVFSRRIDPLSGGSPELLAGKEIRDVSGALAGREELWLLMQGDGIRVQLSDGFVMKLSTPVSSRGTILKVEVLTSPAQSVAAMRLPRIMPRGRLTSNDLPPPGWISN